MRISASPKFWTTVWAEMQGETGSRLTVKFECQFKRMDEDEKKAFAERLGQAMESADGSQSAAMTDQLMEVITDWRGVTDENDQPAQFDRDNLLRMVKMGMTGAILYAFREAQTKAKEKN